MTNTTPSWSFEDILRLSIKKQASDIHLKAGVMPVIRKFGRLRPISSTAPILKSDEIQMMALSIMDERQKVIFFEEKCVDIGYGLSGVGRFRVNVFLQRGNVRMVIRYIPAEIPRLGDLNLPPTVRMASKYQRGLVLVTGTTGSGKSTTLASILDEINLTSNKHIVTIEDPIEYLIQDRKSIISQLEVGSDTENFGKALRSSLRQDPDVILIGEMRDRETIEIALTAAETGHLVLSTLHTADASETINRILSVFPTHQHTQIRYQLASVLECVISQRLARRADNQGFVPAVEVLVNNPRVAELIQDPTRTQELQDVIGESEASWGMQTFDQSLMDLVEKKLVSYDHALELATRPDDFALRSSGVSADKDHSKWQEPAKEDSAELQMDQWKNVEELEVETQVRIPRAAGDGLEGTGAVQTQQRSDKIRLFSKKK